MPNVSFAPGSPQSSTSTVMGSVVVAAGRMTFASPWIVACLLPSKSPWLNPIEPKWVHGKWAVLEPARVLSEQELVDRVYAYYGCEHEPHLSIPEKVA